jgi:beta-1,4-mannosyltransferase
VRAGRTPGSRPQIPLIAGIPIGPDAYTICFYDALRLAGASIVNGDLSGRWLLAQRGRVDYLHLHWPSFLYRKARPLNSVFGFGRFVLLLALARLCGLRLLWTAHNLYPHERTRPAFLDELGRALLIRMCHKVFAHGDSAAAIVAREFPAVRGKLVIIPHGNWINHYACNTDRASARARLGIPDEDLVFLSFGSCREYKNLEHLVRSFQRKVAGDASLWIVGRFQTAEYAKRVKRQIDERPQGIRLVDAFIPDEQVQHYFVACDVVVLAYAEVLTSGSAMLALGFGRPIVAPRLGHLEDVIDDPSGVLYDPAEPDGLANAMMAASKRKFEESAIVKHARRFDWRDAAARTLSALG